MAGYRIDRINEEIARALAELIRGLKDPRISGLVSITRVDTARDLGCAKVYISCYGEEGETIKGLKSAAGYLRRELSRAVDLRAVPELRFFKDDSLNEGSRILSVMNELSSAEAEKEDE
ncbi:MAG: 30S ribosome-binding factor RbfA [Clostridia bacterium]|nr:30S ribosome-binding factor RbfA [Clostridia bacterium]